MALVPHSGCRALQTIHQRVLLCLQLEGITTTNEKPLLIKFRGWSFSNCPVDAWEIP
jgi:hypothetical protein